MVEIEQNLCSKHVRFMVSIWVRSKAYLCVQDVGGLVMVIAYVLWSVLLVVLPIVQAEGGCGHNGTKWKHCSSCLKKVRNYCIFVQLFLELGTFYINIKEDL